MRGRGSERSGLARPWNRMGTMLQRMRCIATRGLRARCHTTRAAATARRHTGGLVGRTLIINAGMTWLRTASKHLWVSSWERDSLGVRRHDRGQPAVTAA